MRPRAAGRSVCAGGRGFILPHASSLAVTGSESCGVIWVLITHVRAIRNPRISEGGGQKDYPSKIRAGWALPHQAVSRAYQHSPQRALNPLDAFSAAS